MIAWTLNRRISSLEVNGERQETEVGRERKAGGRPDPTKRRRHPVNEEIGVGGQEEGSYAMFVVLYENRL